MTSINKLWASKMMWGFIILSLFLIPLSSATASFSNYDVYAPNPEPYGAIDVWDGNWIFPDVKMATYTLTKNTDECLIDCYAEGTATLYQDGTLFDDVTFKNGLPKEASVTLIDGEEFETDIPDYNESCENIYDEMNKTTYPYCRHEQIGTHRETQYRNIIYNGDTLFAGTYKWRIDGKLNIGDKIDWIGISNGVELDKWAWWDSSWAYKQQINITGTLIANYTQRIVVNKSANMQSTYGDLRFTDYSETYLLPYWIETYNSTQAIVHVWTSLNNSIYMYYGNAGATTTSNIGGAFIFGDDFEDSSLNATKWTTYAGANAGCGVQTETGGYYNYSSVASNKRCYIYTALTNGINWTFGFNSTFKAMVANHLGMTDFAFSNDPLGVCMDGIYMLDEVSNDSLNFEVRTVDTGCADRESKYYVGKNSTGNHVQEFYHIQNSTFTSTFDRDYGTRVISGGYDIVNNAQMRLFIGAGGTDISIQQVWWVWATPRIDPYPTTSFGVEEAGVTPLSITTTLISPANNTNSSTNLITFSANATAVNGNVTNFTLYIWNGGTTTNFTNGFTGTFNSTSWVQSGITDGNKTWNVLSCAVNQTGSACAWNTNRTLTIDTIAPAVNINGLVNISFVTSPYNQLMLPVSTDLHLDYCWYNSTQNTTLIYIPCGTTFEVNFTSGGQKTIQFWANDTFGNINTTSTSAFFNYIQPVLNITTPIVEGETHIVYFNVTANNIYQTNATATYNGTAYPMTLISNNETLAKFSKTLIAPWVSVDTNFPINISYFVNGDNWTTSQTQIVTNFYLDNCSTNSIKLYTFTIKDESNQVALGQTLNNTQGKVDMQVYVKNSDTLVYQFNRTYSQINPFSVCINSSLSTESYRIFGVIEYKADNYQTEFYNIQNDTINSSSIGQNISLYDLVSSTAQTFKLIIKDGSFLAIKDALVEVHRKYIEEGVYKIVEIPKTDANGESLASLVLNDVIYKFIIKKFGSVLATFSDVRAVCQTPLVSPCIIDFNAFATGISVPDYEALADFNFTLGFNKTSRAVTSIFVIPSGGSSSVQLVVEIQDALRTQACNSTTTGASGTLTCIVPNTFGNTTALAKIYRDGELQAQGSVNMAQSPSDIYGGVLVFLALFIMMTLLGAAMSDNPVFTIVFFVVGVIILFAMNLVANNGFIGATATILWLIVAIVIVIIKGAKRT